MKEVFKKYFAVLGCSFGPLYVWCFGG